MPLYSPCIKSTAENIIKKLYLIYTDKKTITMKLLLVLSETLTTLRWVVRFYLLNNFPVLYVDTMSRLCKIVNIIWCWFFFNAASQKDTRLSLWIYFLFFFNSKKFKTWRRCQVNWQNFKNILIQFNVMEKFDEHCLH